MAEKFNISIVFDALDKASSVISGLADKLDSFGLKFAEIRKNYEKISGSVYATGQTMTNNVSRPLARFGKDIFSTALDFETAMNSLQTKMLDMKGNLDTEAAARLRAEALRLGATTAFTATQSVMAMKELMASGMSVNETLAVTGKVLQLATGGELKMADAARYAVNIMNSMGLRAGDISKNFDRVTKTLAVAANQSTADVSHIAEGFKTVGGTARGLGLDVEMVGAMLAKMANMGERGGLAGTLLRNALLRVVNTTGKSKQAFAEMGNQFGFNISQFVDSQGKITNFMGLLDKLSGKVDIGKLTVKTIDPGTGEGITKLIENNQEIIRRGGVQVGALFRAFGERGARAILSLIAGGTKDLNQLYKDLQENSPLMRKMQEQMLKGLPGAVIMFKNSIEALMHTIASSWFGKAIEGFINLITKFIGYMVGSHPQLVSFVSILLAVAAAIGPLLIAFGFIGGNLTKLVTGFSLLGKLIGGTINIVRMLAPVLLSLSKIFVVASMSALKFGAAMLVAGGPPVWIAAAIVALIATIILLYRNWDMLTEKFNSLSVGMRIAIAVFTAPFMALFGWILLLVGGLKKITKEFGGFGGMMKAIGEKIRGVGTAIKDIFFGLGESAAAMFKQAWDTVLNWLRASLKDVAIEYLKWVSGYKAVEFVTGKFTAGKEKKSQVDVNINLKSEKGTSSSIQSITKQGGSSVKINNTSTLGKTR